MPASTRDLRQVAYFAGLPDAALADVAGAAVERAYERGELISRQDEACPGLFTVLSGRVRIFKTSADGREQVLTLLAPGESFNDVPAFDGGPNPATAEAVEPTRVLLVARSDVVALLARHPAFAANVVRILASRLRHLAGLVEDLSFRHVSGRLAKILLSQAERPDAARLTQQDMAAMAGTAREVVGRALKAFEQEGILRIERGRIVIVDRKRLADLV